MDGFSLLQLQEIKTQILAAISEIAGGSGGGNPDGGTVDIATVNYQTAVLLQWIALTTGSGSAFLMNLVNSALEPFNLASQTLLYFGYSTLPGGSAVAAVDNAWAFQAGSGSRLPGIMNPAHLRYAGHMQGSGTFNGIIAADVPVYVSNTTFQLKTSGMAVASAALPALDGFTGGTASSSSGTAANAFNATGATTGNDATPFFEYDLGSGNAVALRYFSFSESNSGGWSSTFVFIQGSNDNASWTNLIGIAGANQFVDSANVTSYRYYRIAIPTKTSTLTVTNFMGFQAGTIYPTYDTSNFVLGNSSVLFPGPSYLSGSVSSSNEVVLENFDWQLRGYVRPTSAPGTFTIFSIPNSLEIQMTSTGLQVRYRVSGSFTAVTSTSLSWTPGTWYYISVRRTANVIYFFVNGTAEGSTACSATFDSGSTFNIAADSTPANNFIGNIQELEFFVQDHDVDTAPVAIRSTAFIPSVTWVSGSAYIPTGATTLYALLMQDEQTWKAIGSGVPVVSSDWNLSVSLDNGSTWHTVSMSKTTSLTTLTNMYAGFLALAGVTNTNQLQYKITSASGKVMKCDGVVMYWQ